MYRYYIIGYTFKSFAKRFPVFLFRSESEITPLRTTFSTQMHPLRPLYSSTSKFSSSPKYYGGQLQAWTRLDWPCGQAWNFTCLSREVWCVRMRAHIARRKRDRQQSSTRYQSYGIEICWKAVSSVLLSSVNYENRARSSSYCSFQWPTIQRCVWNRRMLKVIQHIFRFLLSHLSAT